jgi:hypothetical protein
MGRIPSDPPINLPARSYPTTINIGNVASRGSVLVRHGKTVQKHHDEEVDMLRSFTTALVGALLLGSVGIASAQTVQRYDDVSYPHQSEMYCYLPSSPCDNNHRVTN